MPVVATLKDAYLAWQMALPHVAKVRRQSIASRIDTALLDTLEYSFRAGYASGQVKVESISTAITRLDIAKFFLLVAWECGAITDAQYLRIGSLLADANKMLVGWKSYSEKKTPADGRK